MYRNGLKSSEIDIRECTAVIVVIHSASPQHGLIWLEFVTAEFVSIEVRANVHDCLQHFLLHPVTKLGLEKIHLRKHPLHSCIRERECKKRQCKVSQFVEYLFSSSIRVLQNPQPELLSLHVIGLRPLNSRNGLPLHFSLFKSPL